MSTVKSLYRSTLIAAALAASTLAAVPAAEAHEQGWREHGPERAWQPAPPRGWVHRGYVRPGYGYYAPPYVVAPADCAVLPLVPGYAPVVYRPHRPWVPVVEVRARL